MAGSGQLPDPALAEAEHLRGLGGANFHNRKVTQL
jgi:hypothetical protein